MTTGPSAHISPVARDREPFADVEVRTRRYWVLFLVALPHLARMIGILLGARAFMAPLTGGLTSLLMIPVLLTFYKWSKRRHGQVTVDGDALRLDGESVVRRNRVKQALMYRETEEGNERFVVRITSRFRRIIDLRLGTSGEAERLLAALEQSETQVTARFNCFYGGSFAPWKIMLLAIAAGLAAPASTFFLVQHGVRHGPLLYIAAFAPVFFLVTALQLRVCRVTVGADGIAVSRRLRKTRFLPFSEVTGVSREKKREVVVALTGGRAPLRLGVAGGDRSFLGAEADAPALTLVQRIEDARHRAADDPRLPARALLARGSLGREEWRRRVDQLADEASSYRESSIPAEELWKVLADSRETADVRAAAALAVRHSLDDAGRDRVRIAASTVADAPLRRIFTAVNKGDDAEIDEALDEMEAVNPAQRAVAR